MTTSTTTTKALFDTTSTLTDRGRTLLPVALADAFKFTPKPLSYRVFDSVRVVVSPSGQVDVEATDTYAVIRISTPGAVETDASAAWGFLITKQDAAHLTSLIASPSCLESMLDLMPQVQNDHQWPQGLDAVMTGPVKGKRASEVILNPELMAKFAIRSVVKGIAGVRKSAPKYPEMVIRMGETSTRAIQIEVSHKDSPVTAVGAIMPIRGW